MYLLLWLCLGSLFIILLSHRLSLCVFLFRSCTWSSPGWWRVCLAVWTGSSPAGTCDSCTRGAMSTTLWWSFWTPGTSTLFALWSQQHVFTSAAVYYTLCLLTETDHCYFSHLIMLLFSVGRWWTSCTNFKQKSTNMKYPSIISR